jgi:arginine decarboxylase
MQGPIAVLADVKFARAQETTPLYDALVKYATSDVTPFDVPGHKRGFKHPLQETIGDMALKMDANSMPELDLLSHPTSVIEEAQRLAAQAFQVDRAYFLVNGTTVGILAMILATCKPGDQLIVPRNCHKSVMNGILLSGAIPVFIQPEVDQHFGIAHGISLNQVKEAIVAYPQAKALFITYPTYFGAMNELQEICKLAHERGMVVLADSAHGAHLSVMPEMDAIEAGADIVTISMHKTGGSLTQSSMLLLQEQRMSATKIQKVLNMLQTTSASYLLMSSLDVARRELTLYGAERFRELKPIVMQAIENIEHNSKYEVLKTSYMAKKFHQHYDWTKLVIRVNDLGLTGFEVYTLLKQKYGIQAELAEGYVVMCVISYADTAESLERLVSALKDIERNYSKSEPLVMQMVVNDEINTLAMAPQQASHADSETIDIEEAVGRISADTIMIYPPGIPLIIPGEIISDKVVALYHHYSRNIGNVLGENEQQNQITVVKGDR